MTLIDELSFEQPKTEDMAAILKALKLDGTSLLVAVAEHDVNVYKSLRNLANVSVVPVADLNALNVLRPQRLLMTTAALDAFCGKKAEGRRGCVQDRGTAGCVEMPGRKQRVSRTRGWTEDSHGPRHAPRPAEVGAAPDHLPAAGDREGDAQGDRCNAYAFEVNRMAGKDDVRRAVEELFDVKVVRVTSRTARASRGSPIPPGNDRAPGKKPIVTLGPEHRINFF